MFGLLNACKTASLGESLAFDHRVAYSKGRIKWTSLNNDHVKPDQHLSI